MKLLLDTSTPVCRLTLVDDDGVRRESHWQADRTLADGLLSYIEDTLQMNGANLQHVTGLGAYQGPGSFTGLRIGLTVLNTLADGLGVPIVGAQGNDWQDTALAKLAAGNDERLVMPVYGRAANITTPRK